MTTWRTLIFIAHTPRLLKHACRDLTVKLLSTTVEMSPGDSGRELASLIKPGLLTIGIAGLLHRTSPQPACRVSSGKIGKILQILAE